VRQSLIAERFIFKDAVAITVAPAEYQVIGLCISQLFKGSQNQKAVADLSITLMIITFRAKIAQVSFQLPL
jgi:hypothetical protein